MTNFDIRPFQEEDRAAVTEIENSNKPEFRRSTVAEWQRGDARRPAGEVRVRFCIGNPAIAYASAVDRSTSAYRKEGVCGFSILVDPAHRRRGLGSALYDKVVQFAQERGLSRLITYVTLEMPDEPAAPFLAGKGFEEIDRDVPVMLDLTAFNTAPHLRPLPAGFRLTSLADAGDTEENRRRIWELDGAIHKDIPTNDVLPEMPPFEQWNKELDGPEFDPRAVVLVENADGEWVGLSALGFQEETNVGWTFITGVLPDHRGQGLASALKLAAIDAAKTRGCRLILTENHEDNAPMRAINRKLGFQPDAPGVSYSKTL